VEEVQSLAKTQVRIAIDPFRVVGAVLNKAQRRPRLAKIVTVDYDEEADVLYARFKHGKIVDSEPPDTHGMVPSSLDSKNHVVGLVLVHASTFASHAGRMASPLAACLTVLNVGL
jgi:uncharacterized protein YuzE